MKMDWATLYSARRSGEFKSLPEGQELRTSFVRDYDRLIFSSAFRRLQNKTQVFPLPGAVLVHNRLTHSLEVASVGRSLGKAVGDAIADRNPYASQGFHEFYKYELPSVIAAACLAHDIGNPPFGHSGEDAIRTFFGALQGNMRSRFESELTSNQQRDFLFFEGNANALRVLTHHFNEAMTGGYRLTYTTLASIVKYPCTSERGFNKKALVTKKSGYFDSEWPLYRQLAAVLGIPALDEACTTYCRHPFVFLVEAADDICYRIIDLEDAHRLGVISLDDLLGLLLPLLEGQEGSYSRKRVSEVMDNIRDENQKIQFLRARIINLLVQLLAEVFMKYEETLLQGNLLKPLLHFLPESIGKVIDQIDSYSVKHIYNHRLVVEIELAGYNIIGSLLNTFVTAVFEPKSSKSSKLLQLIPAQYPINGNSLYNDLQSVVDYVSGMTDVYAVDLYRRITGIEVPTFR